MWRPYATHTIHLTSYSLRLPLAGDGSVHIFWKTYDSQKNRSPESICNLKRLTLHQKP